MAFERKWAAIAPINFTQDGTTTGMVTVADTSGFYVKQSVFLVSSIRLPQQFQIKWIFNSTQLIVGPNDNKVGRNFGSDISSFLFSQSAQIAAGEQDKNNIPDKDHYSAIYEADPIVADRVILVDRHGDLYGPDNALPIQFDGTITVGDVKVQGTNGNILEPNADGSISVVIVETPISGQVVKSIYNQIMAIPSGSTTSLITYTVPAGKTAVLERITVSGDNIARYDILYNSNPFETKRTYFGGNMNEEFDFTTGSSNGFVLNTGDVIVIQVLHGRPYPGSFNARLQVLEIA